MRIIAGKFRSRKLLSPPIGATTRPIPDRVKESLFSMLRGHFEGATVLDAFAGTGAIGLEAVSRGATRVVMVERDKRTAEVIRRNVEMLGCTEEAEVVVGDMLGAAALARVPRPIDVVFFDPPYALVMDPMGWDRVRAQFLAAVRLLAEDGFAVLRTPWPFRLSADTPVAPEAAETPDLVRRAPEPKRKRARDDRRWDWRTELDSGGKPAARGPRPPEKSKELDEELDELGSAEIDFDAVEIDMGAEMGADMDAEMDADANEAEAEVSAPSGDEAPIQSSLPLVDMRLPGTKGPETHVYRHTAVHLYMKDTGAAGGAGA